MNTSIELPFVYSNTFPKFTQGQNRIIKLTLERLLPNYIYDMSKAEGCDYTIIDIKTYICDGITIGGHRISDEAIVRNIANGYSYLLKKFPECCDLRQLITTFHTLINDNFIDNLENFRKIRVGISGTKAWRPFPCKALPVLYKRGLNIIQNISNPLEQGVILFLWLCYCQFFEDGNKRTARLSANYIFMHNRIGIFTIPVEYWKYFSKLLTEFYDTADATRIIDFILRYCFTTFTENDVDKFVGEDVEITSEFI